MKVNVKHLQEDPKTGILRYRRVFPAALRPFISENGRQLTELKVSIGARSINEPGAKARHDAAAAKYQAMVARAEKLANRSYDSLPPHLVQYLADQFLHCHAAIDETSRWRQPPPDFPFETRRDREEDYIQSREMLEDYDGEGLVEYWSDYAASFSHALGHTFDTSTPAFASLCRALGEAACKLWLTVDKRNDGLIVVTPSEPVVPYRQLEGHAVPEVGRSVPLGDDRSFETIALELIGNPQVDIGEAVKEHVRTGLRYLGEALGSPRPVDLTRSAITRLLDLMAQRPIKLTKAERALTLPELADLYRDKPEVPRMSSRTVEVRMSALSTAWTKAFKREDNVDELPNPFIGRTIKKTRRPKTAKGFSPNELKAYFSMPCFQAGERPVRGRAEAIYWLPLVALFTGARPEEVGQLLVDDIFHREEDGRWVIRFTDEGIHPVKGPQTLKTARYEYGRRTFPVHQALLDLGLLDYRQHLERHGQLALFPSLRIKGARGGLYESFGGWFADYIYDHGVLPRGAGRQPVREFRHTWATAARASGIAKDAREYMQGRASGGRHSSDDDYGEHMPLGSQIDHLKFKVDILSIVPRWKP